jgi:hypothetical protein
MIYYIERNKKHITDCRCTQGNIVYTKKLVAKNKIQLKCYTQCIINETHIAQNGMNFIINSL